MAMKDLNLNVLSNLALQQVDHVTCIECCKFYIVPETNVCGHTLCHLCWRTRRTCPSCSTSIDRKQLKLNLPLQMLTEHVHSLSDLFEKLFHIKLTECDLDTPQSASEKDQAKGVKAWLASSENHFSAPNTESQSPQEVIVNVTSSKIQIHDENTKKVQSPVKTVHVHQKQDDWDKIETVLDTEDVLTKNKENIIGPMDIEPFVFDDQEYSTNNLRRSSRKKDFKTIDSNHTIDTSADKHSSAKNTSNEIDKKSSASKQNWCNVKRMRKEFSKLNKKNKSKLNVSIEMCKKTSSAVLKSKPLTPTAVSQQVLIDDDTPDFNKVDKSDIGKDTEMTMYNEKPNKKLIDEISLGNEATTLAENSRSINKDVKTAAMKENVSLNGMKKAVPSVIDDKLTEQKRLPFYKKSPLHTVTNDEQKVSKLSLDNRINSMTTNTDDIEISIKIGNTLTNILIKKKTNDLKMKDNTDKEIQTSLGPHVISCKSDGFTNNVQNIEISIGEGNQQNSKKDSCSDTIEQKTDMVQKPPVILEKSVSTKKNTASAETATVNFEITESVEKELSNVMEIADEEMVCDDASSQNANHPNDVDIFNSGSVKDQNVQYLKKFNHAPSEILPSLKVNKVKSQKTCTKRDRDTHNEDKTNEPAGKKPKVSARINQKSPESENLIQGESKDNGNESENYDAIMGKVFANIDADIDIIQKSQTKSTSKNNNDNISSQILFNTQKCKSRNANKSVTNTQVQNNKCSENLFSIIDKENETNNLDVFMEEVQAPGPNTQNDIDNLLTPGICRDIEAQNDGKDALAEDVELLDELGTPMQDHYDSDKSVVEETPQKNFSFSKPKQKNGPQTNSKTSNDEAHSQAKSSKSQDAGSVINLSDTIPDSGSKSKDATVVEAPKRKQTLETPLNINKFFDHVTHKSTPMARKSLNFENNQEGDDKDLEQTLCPSATVAKTTQENEFMRKAFEDTVSPKIRLLSPKVIKRLNQKFCLVGSCLTASELANVKLLCCERNWVYADKYTVEMTHLIVGVDEENRSQRSVKYMCALAASKWIVSYAWVEKCLLSKTLVDEEQYEALDATGDCGPRRSRTAEDKLFKGISFYCMPPFSVLDVNTLKSILEAAGGRVVPEAKQVRVTSADSPLAMLLAEPENTQEDRFIYLAMEVSIVPVNYEWVLNCLGSYSLTSIHDLLLCPATLLPPPTKKWPPALIEQDSE